MGDDGIALTKEPTAGEEQLAINKLCFVAGLFKRGCEQKTGPEKGTVILLLNTNTTVQNIQI